MAFFSGRASMLEVQNRALIKSAGERARRISELEGELQQLKAEMERAQIGARVLLQQDPSVRGVQQQSHRVSQPILLMGPEPGARTCQNRSRWPARAPVRTLDGKPGRHAEKTAVAPHRSIDFVHPCSLAGLLKPKDIYQRKQHQRASPWQTHSRNPGLKTIPASWRFMGTLKNSSRQVATNLTR